MGILGYTRVYKGIQWVYSGYTREHKGVQWVY